MFPIPWNKAFRKKDGTLVNMEDISGGGGGGSFTPDYENDRLEVGTHEGFNYYIPMSKEPIGGFDGYEIKTNPASSVNDAMIDLYHYANVDGVIYTQFIKTLHHDATKGDNTYSDENISVRYQSGWILDSNVTLYNESGEAYADPLTWGYSTTVDYVMLFESPV